MPILEELHLKCALCSNTSANLAMTRERAIELARSQGWTVNKDADGKLIAYCRDHRPRESGHQI